jgi:hypothetical protein
MGWVPMTFRHCEVHSLKAKAYLLPDINGRYLIVETQLGIVCKLGEHGSNVA